MLDREEPMLDREVEAALARAAELFEANPPKDRGTDALRQQMRETSAWWNEGGPTMYEEASVIVPGHQHLLQGILYRPSPRTDLPVYVFLHGGGFRFGDASSNARQLRAIASEWGGCVLSLDYPHIPEAPFPAAVEEIGAAYRWLASDANQLPFRGEYMAVGGASAGANISCGAIVEIGGAATSPFLRAVALVVPVFDGSTDTVSMAQFGDGPYFPTRAATEATWRDYLVLPSHDYDPRANLMLAPSDAFPPMFIAAAEMDVFRDGATRMYGRQKAARKEVELHVYPGMTHLYFGYARMVATARRTATDLAKFLSRHLSLEA